MIIDICVNLSSFRQVLERGLMLADAVQGLTQIQHSTHVEGVVVVNDSTIFNALLVLLQLQIGAGAVSDKTLNVQPGGSYCITNGKQLYNRKISLLGCFCKSEFNNLSAC